jgi:membrane AbrB-like protein
MTDSRWFGWLVLFAVVVPVAGFVDSWRLLPAADLVVPLLVGALLGLTGLVRGQPPRRMSRAGQAMLGVLMGSYLRLDLIRSVSGDIVVLAVVTVLTIGLSLVGAALLARYTRIDRATAALGMVAGGSAAVIGCADELDADARLVAFMQYARVGLVALTAPFVAQLAATGFGAAAPGGGTFDLGWRLVSGPDQFAGVAVAVLLAQLGLVAGERCGLPGGAVIGPMLLSALVTMAGLGGGFAPAGVLKAVVIALIGLEAGLRFRRDTIRAIRAVLPAVSCCVLALSVAVGAVAFGLARLAKLPFLDAYLATTPGGINAVLATAESGNANLALVSGVQSLRLFVMVLLLPVVRLWARRAPAVPGPRVAAACECAPDGSDRATDVGGGADTAGAGVDCRCRG